MFVVKAQKAPYRAASITQPYSQILDYAKKVDQEQTL